MLLGKKNKEGNKHMLTIHLSFAFPKLDFSPASSFTLLLIYLGSFQWDNWHYKMCQISAAPPFSLFFYRVQILWRCSCFGMGLSMYHLPIRENFLLERSPQAAVPAGVFLPCHGACPAHLSLVLLHCFSIIPSSFSLSSASLSFLNILLQRQDHFCWWAQPCPLWWVPWKVAENYWNHLCPAQGWLWPVLKGLLVWFLLSIYLVCALLCP